MALLAEPHSALWKARQCAREQAFSEPERALLAGSDLPVAAMARAVWIERAYVSRLQGVAALLASPDLRLLERARTHAPFCRTEQWLTDLLQFWGFLTLDSLSPRGHILLGVYKEGCQDRSIWRQIYAHLPTSSWGADRLPFWHRLGVVLET